MRTFVLTAVLLAVSAFPSVVTPAGAQAPASDSTAASASSPTVTKANLEAFLESAGCKPEKTKDDLSIKVDRFGQTYSVRAALSGNGRKLWLSVYLAEIPDIAKVSAETLTSLLSANLDIGPAHFYLADGTSKSAKRLKVAYAIDAWRLTAEDFKKDFDDLTLHIKETEKLWAASNFTASGR